MVVLDTNLLLGENICDRQELTNKLRVSLAMHMEMGIEAQAGNLLLWIIQPWFVADARVLVYLKRVHLFYGHDAEYYICPVVRG